MSIPRLTLPKEVSESYHTFASYAEIPEAIFAEIHKRFEAKRCENPLVSVNIIAWNEDQHILNCLSSLSKVETSFPIEFVFVDNNSSDHTADIIRRCGLTPVSEKKQGLGFARQTALNNSKGKYIITGDADTIYLPHWAEMMVSPLIAGRASATYGSYSFIPSEGKKRQNYFFYELMRNMLHAIRAINRPELVVVSMNFCFHRELALKIGFIQSDARMEDGQMALRLKKYGKLLRITKPQTFAWTIPHRVEELGSLFSAVLFRIKKEAKRISIYFSKANPT